MAQSSLCLWVGLLLPLISSDNFMDCFNEDNFKEYEFGILTSLLRIQDSEGANGFPWWLSGKESACQCRRCGFDPWIWKILWRRKWQPAPVFLPGKSHGQRSLAGWDPPFFVVFMCLPDVHGCCPGHGVLQFGGLQRVGHDLVTKQQQRCWWHLIPAPCVLQVVGTVMAGFAMSFTLTGHWDPPH